MIPVAAGGRTRHADRDHRAPDAARRALADHVEERRRRSRDHREVHLALDLGERSPRADATHRLGAGAADRVDGPGEAAGDEVPEDAGRDGVGAHGAEHGDRARGEESFERMRAHAGFRQAGYSSEIVGHPRPICGS